MLGHGEPHTGIAPFPESSLNPPGYFQTKNRRNFGIPKSLWRGEPDWVSLDWGLVKGGGSGGATAEEASALSIEILLSGAKPKFGSKVPFLVTTPGGTCDRFLQIIETFVGFFACRTHF